MTLELILTLPIWVIFLFATVQFGQLLINLQQVSLASRVGAEEASHTPGLPLAGGVPTNIVEAIETQLNSSGIAWCRIILEHSVTPPPPPIIPQPVVLTSGVCACSPPPTSLLPTTGNYVRVTVCVPATELAPNLLCPFGLNLTTTTFQRSTTFRYELTTP